MITINETKDLGTVRDGDPVKFYVYDAENAEWVEWGGVICLT